MVIKKFLHSCILIEEGGKRLLFDPGNYSFIEGKIKPQDIGKVDVLIYTHKHLDHYDPKVIPEFITPATKIIASQEIVDLLTKDGFRAEPISENQEIEVSGFTIKAIDAPHERVPTEIPHNFGYLINNRFFHPGDSISVAGLSNCEVLALPVAGPWNKLADALEFAVRMKPKVVIPVHDVMIKDFLLERIYSYMCEPYLKKNNIGFKPLKIGESLEI